MVKQSYARFSLIIPLDVFVSWWFKRFTISSVGSAVESPRHTEPCERLPSLFLTYSEVTKGVAPA
ncbi:MAG: hypothetical protein GXY55_17505 [Phycisphaerae bacterium]|nr:hypothetical protein [Phycisphaerae bacterium]